nr:MAG TPA: TOPRIM primase [Caudoviricetes sp.]
MKIDLSQLKPLSGQIDWSEPQWLILERLYNLVKSTQSWTGKVEVGRPLRDDAVDVVERIGKNVLFWYQREVFGPRRSTSIDRYGLIGLSALNLRSRQIVLTEGVSDFLSFKMCYPDLNVLGFTTLGGNLKSTKILLTLSDELILISDNDFGKEKNTGLINVMELKTYYESKGKKVSVLFPSAPHKDITQQIMFELKH